MKRAIIVEIHGQFMFSLWSTEIGQTWRMVGEDGEPLPPPKRYVSIHHQIN